MICGSEGVALDADLGGTHRGKAHNVRKEPMNTALTHGAIMTRVSAKVQLPARLIGGYGDA